MLVKDGLAKIKFDENAAVINCDDKLPREHVSFGPVGVNCVKVASTKIVSLAPVATLINKQHSPRASQGAHWAQNKSEKNVCKKATKFG